MSSIYDSLNGILHQIKFWYLCKFFFDFVTNEIATVSLVLKTPWVAFDNTLGHWRDGYMTQLF